MADVEMGKVFLAAADSGKLPVDYCEKIAAPMAPIMVPRSVTARTFIDCGYQMGLTDPGHVAAVHSAAVTTRGAPSCCACCKGSGRSLNAPSCYECQRSPGGSWGCALGCYALGCCAHRRAPEEPM
jgi:hypothetical protein